MQGRFVDQAFLHSLQASLWSLMVGVCSHANVYSASVTTSLSLDLHFTRTVLPSTPSALENAEDIYLFVLPEKVLGEQPGATKVIDTN